jgi:hypothetical protein
LADEERKQFWPWWKRWTSGKIRVFGPWCWKFFDPFETKESGKESDMEEDDPDIGKKRGAGDGRVDILSGNINTANEGAAMNVDGATKVGALAAQFEPGPPPSPIPVRDTKRKKKTDKSDSTVNSELAGSMEGRRQDQ